MVIENIFLIAFIYRVVTIGTVNAALLKKA